MSILSVKTRIKTYNLAFSAAVILLVYLLQLTVLNKLYFESTICNLPLTLTILWGFVFGSTVRPVSADELRTASSIEIFIHQMLRGSSSALLVGAFFSALYASVLPMYPVCFPLVGWIAGYFSLRNLSQETLLCIPLVLLVTVLGELIMAWQLNLTGHALAFQHLSQISLPEALLNALVAPFIYFPMRTWYDFTQTQRPVS